MTDPIDELLSQRDEHWGDAREAMTRTAKAWSGIFGFVVTPIQVPLAMTALKAVRASINPSVKDSFDDLQGYTKIAGKMAGHYPDNQNPLPNL